MTTFERTVLSKWTPTPHLRADGERLPGPDGQRARRDVHVLDADADVHVAAGAEALHGAVALYEVGLRLHLAAVVHLEEVVSVKVEGTISQPGLGLSSKQISPAHRMRQYCVAERNLTPLYTMIDCLHIK